MQVDVRVRGMLDGCHDSAGSRDSCNVLHVEWNEREKERRGWGEGGSQSNNGMKEKKRGDVPLDGGDVTEYIVRTLHEC